MADVLKGKVVIVTGAGRGVGAEIAKLAAAEGARVVVNDLGVSQDGQGGSLGPAEEVVQEIKAAGGEAIADGNNVATWDGAHGLIATAMKAFGDLDAIVNNAGILRDTIFHKMSPEEWNAVIQVNLTGVFNVSRAAAPHFKDKQKGSFVHMTSTSGRAVQEHLAGHGEIRRAIQRDRAVRVHAHGGGHSGHAGERGAPPHQPHDERG
jgi:NAD(P)-dependent dehydrogenase (short-subunit alcohol dehydrogenase family)